MVVYALRYAPVVSAKIFAPSSNHRSLNILLYIFSKTFLNQFSLNAPLWNDSFSCDTK